MIDIQDKVIITKAQKANITFTQEASDFKLYEENTY